MPDGEDGAPSYGALTMHQTVLVAATPDDRGRDALALGLSLARPVGAGMVVADVVRNAGGRVGSALDAVLEQLKALRDEAPGDIEITVEVIASTSILAGLHDLAIEHDADLLVVNPEHRSAVARTLHGDLVADAIFTAPCAVAVACETRRAHEPRLIGVGWNGTPESYEALEWATQLAERTGASVQILRALDARHPEGTEPEAGVRSRAIELRDHTRLRAQADTTLEWGDAAPLLIGMSRGLDLLVLGSRARGPVGRTILGSVSTDIVHHAECPVVVLPRRVHAPADTAAA